MNGAELLNRISQQIIESSGKNRITDSELANYLGVSVPTINLYKRKELSSLQVARLIKNATQAHEKKVVEDSLKVIVEFFPIDVSYTNRGVNYRIFPTSGDRVKTYYEGLKKELDSTYGIYIFYDSRGKAIYTGKAKRQSLWKEINIAINRERMSQTMYYVEHPLGKEYAPSSERKRKIKNQNFYIGDVARYVNAYAVAEIFIDKLEAYLIRAFPNDLTNIKMENI